MNRRDFLRTVGGSAGAATAAGAAASPAAASDVSARALSQDEDEDEADDEEADDEEADDEEADDEEAEEEDGDDVDSDLPGAGETETVIVGPSGATTSYDPEELFVLPGTTVQFVWESDTHNLFLDSGPDDGWDGYDPIEDEGFEYEHTFEVEGEYHYYCEPHVAAGMEADIIVTEDIPEDDGVEEVDPAHMGVPIQKHFVGIATFLAIFVTFVFTFYVLKYGESAHSSAPGKK